MRKTADVVVIGGGVMGTAAAYELSRRGAGTVVLLEKSSLGSGSSGKSGANVRQHYSHALTASMAQYGLRFFERFSDELGGPEVFTRAGLAMIVPSDQRAHLEANVDLQQKLGIKVSLISQAEMQSIDPGVVLGENEVFAFESEAGYVDPLQVVISFAENARRRGVEICEGVPASGIEVEGGRIAAVSTPGGRIATRAVVLAAGPWASRLVSPLGVDLPVRPCRTQIALLRRPCRGETPRPIYGDFANQIYFRAMPGDQLHLGNIDPREERAEVDPDNYNEVADRQFVFELRDKLYNRYPSMRNGAGRGGYGALYSVTPDWHPIIDGLPGVEDAVCAAGFSGHGFKMSPAVSKLIGEMVLDGGPKTFDIHPLRASRFAEGERFGSQRAYTVMG